MGLWDILKSDMPLEYKFWSLKVYANIFYNELLLSTFGQTFMAIIGDEKFWLTGTVVFALCFFGSAEDKNNVEFG